MDPPAPPRAEEAREARWFVMRAYKRERLAEEKLGQDGMECFVPKRYAARTYHGVKSARLVPAIPSLVFVRASRGRIMGFKRRHGFLQFAMGGRRPARRYLTVPDGQMDSFIKAARHGKDATFYKPGEIRLEKGIRVRVHGGELDGVTGTFVRVKGKRDPRVVVLLDGIAAVAAEVRADLVEDLEPGKGRGREAGEARDGRGSEGKGKGGS